MEWLGRADTSFIGLGSFVMAEKKTSELFREDWANHKGKEGHTTHIHTHTHKHTYTDWLTTEWLYDYFREGSWEGASKLG